MGITQSAAKGSEITQSEFDNNWQLFTGAPSAKTLSGDAFTADTASGSGAGRYVLTSESGSTDNLATINGCQNGDMVILFAASGHTITVQHGVGNIKLQGGLNFTLNSVHDHIVLHKVGTTFAGHGINVPA